MEIKVKCHKKRLQDLELDIRLNRGIPRKLDLEIQKLEGKVSFQCTLY